MSFAPPEHSSRVFETEGLIIGGPCSVVVVVGQSTVKSGPQRFQPPEKELGVVEVLYLHLTFCPLGTFTDPLSELPGATD